MATKQRKTTSKTTTAPKKRVARKAPTRKVVATPAADVQNGVRRPKPDTLCGAVWTECDSFLAKHDRSPTAQEMRETAEAKGWNVNNGLCELYQWRKHQGITGRVTATA